MIKNIIFDLGNVILPIDYELSNKAFNQILLKNNITDNRVITDTYFTPLFKSLEKGLIAEQDFYEKICQELHIKATFEEIAHAWNALLLPFPKKNVLLLELLKAQNKYKLFLLSNTNSIHAKAFEYDFRTQFGYEFTSLFTHAYYSQDMGKRKPDADIFVQVLQENQLLPEETLFIDDNLDNRNTAQSLGLKVFATKNADDLLDLFLNI